MYADGCHLNPPETEVPECVYGDPSSETTVVLFGDSHAMQWFPALNELAKEHDWRLVGLTKAACPPAEVHIYNATLRREYRECDEWRERTLERIVREEEPEPGGDEQPPHLQAEGGRVSACRGEASTEAMVEGYASTLKKLRVTGAPVALIEDVPHPNKNIPQCVSRSLDRLRECAFPTEQGAGLPEGQPPRRRGGRGRKADRPDALWRAPRRRVRPSSATRSSTATGPTSRRRTCGPSPPGSPNSCPSRPVDKKGMTP